MKTKNLDVRETSQDVQTASEKHVEHNRTGSTHFNSLCAPGPSLLQLRARSQRRNRVGGSRYVTEQQATKIIEAVRFAKSVGRPLVAHLTIHWLTQTSATTPTVGYLRNSVRVSTRHGFGLSGVWARERMSGGQAEAVHCHLLFYLPHEYRSRGKLLQVEAAIYRLIKRHGHDYWAGEVAKLVIHDKPPYPDGKYPIKGGSPKVWKRFNLRKEHCRSQGIVHGKRCGVTESLGLTARHKCGSRQNG